MSFFFFNDTATTEIYTLSLHDALPIFVGQHAAEPRESVGQDQSRDDGEGGIRAHSVDGQLEQIGKSTRLNSSHANISYAVFCLKKKKKKVHVLTTFTPISSVTTSACTY